MNAATCKRWLTYPLATSFCSTCHMLKLSVLACTPVRLWSVSVPPHGDQQGAIIGECCGAAAQCFDRLCREGGKRPPLLHAARLARYLRLHDASDEDDAAPGAPPEPGHTAQGGQGGAAPGAPGAGAPPCAAREHRGLGQGRAAQPAAATADASVTGAPAAAPDQREGSGLGPQVLRAAGAGAAGAPPPAAAGLDPSLYAWAQPPVAAVAVGATAAPPLASCEQPRQSAQAERPSHAVAPAADAALPCPAFAMGATALPARRARASPPRGHPAGAGGSSDGGAAAGAKRRAASPPGAARAQPAKMQRGCDGPGWAGWGAVAEDVWPGADCEGLLCVAATPPCTPSVGPLDALRERLQGRGGVRQGAAALEPLPASEGAENVAGRAPAAASSRAALADGPAEAAQTCKRQRVAERDGAWAPAAGGATLPAIAQISCMRMCAAPRPAAAEGGPAAAPARGPAGCALLGAGRAAAGDAAGTPGLAGRSPRRQPRGPGATAGSGAAAPWAPAGRAEAHPLAVQQLPKASAAVAAGAAGSAAEGCPAAPALPRAGAAGAGAAGPGPARGPAAREAPGAEPKAAASAAGLAACGVLGAAGMEEAVDAASVSSDSDSDEDEGAPRRAPPAAAPGSGPSASGGWQRLSVATTQADGSGGDAAAARRRLEAYLPAKVVAAFREAGIARDLYQWQARTLYPVPGPIPCTARPVLVAAAGGTDGRRAARPARRAARSKRCAARRRAQGGPSDSCERAHARDTGCSICAAHCGMLHALAKGPPHAADRARVHASSCMLAPRAAWARSRRGGPSPRARRGRQTR